MTEFRGINNVERTGILSEFDKSITYNPPIFTEL